jgi:hypothetical protein
MRVILSENRKCTFWDHAAKKRLEKSRFVPETDFDRFASSLENSRGQNSGAKARRENDRPHPEVLGALAPSLEG